MIKQPIPKPIADAAVALLQPYAAFSLTPEKLEAAISDLDAEVVPESLLTRKEAAGALRVSIPTLDRMLASGQLPRRRIRGAVRIPRSAVDFIISA